MYFFSHKTNKLILTETNNVLLKRAIFKMVQMEKLDFSSQVYASITFQYKITPKLFPTQMSKW